jgi:hypothetical protein
MNSEMLVVPGPRRSSARPSAHSQVVLPEMNSESPRDASASAAGNLTKENA